ncbi:serine acetyltransferase [Denitratisoma sp. agr-D3]
MTDLAVPPAVHSKPPHWDLAAIVQALRESREASHKVRHLGRVRDLPSRSALVKILDGLSAALFPTHYGRPSLTDESIDYYVGNVLNTTLVSLAEQVRRGLLFAATPEELENRDSYAQAQQITRDFAHQLPVIRGLLFSDLQAAYAGDPSATSLSEILVCYPGMTAIIYYRFAHALYVLGVPFLARLISEIAHSKTGIDIHPGASIGGSFFIDHGTGVVIGQTAVIGRNVRLYQAVTLGAKRFHADETGALVKGEARHPIIEDDVVIYAGATVLGRITIGKGSSIGGNVWLTHSVPPASNVLQASNRHNGDQDDHRDD